MHPITRTLIPLLVLFGSVSLVYAAPRTETRTYAMPLRPDTLDGHPIVHTAHVALPQETWRVRQWRTVTVPREWATGDFTYELWDQGNRPVRPGDLLTDETISLADIDATLAPSIRLVLFPQPWATVTPMSGSVTFTASEQFHTRLVGLIGVAALLFVGIVSGLAHGRVGPHTLWSSARAVVHGRPLKTSLQTMSALGALTSLGGATFAFALGLRGGWLQTLFLLVKVPFVLLCALLLTLGAMTVLPALFGVRQTFRSSILSALVALTVTAFGLAASSPIVWWLAWTGATHDTMLLWTLALVAASFSVGTARYAMVLSAHGIRHVSPIIVGWLVVYGSVLLQLAWLLRPWVGFLDPLETTLPFARLASGNVFVELIASSERFITH